MQGRLTPLTSLAAEGAEGCKVGGKMCFAAVIKRSLQPSRILSVRVDNMSTQENPAGQAVVS